MELLERGASLAALRCYADEARTGQGRLVLIAGEAGVGKTALLESFVAEQRDATTAWGACDGLFTPRPLSPLHDVARELGGELRAACARDCPRDELFDAFVAAVSDGEGLRIVVIEDVHWADEATLDLVRHSWRRLGHAPVLFLVTYRDEGLAADALLRRVIGDLASYRGTRRMALPNLSEHAVAQLIGSSPFDADVLHQLTGGNPFFLTEVLAGSGEQVPPSARDAVLARASRLGPEAQSALDVAAVAGSHVDPAVLREVSGAEPIALDECVEAGMLLVHEGGLRFRHDLARLAVAAAVPPQRRVELHRSLLAVLRSASAWDAAELAHHAEQAGDSRAVLEYAPAAARAASAVASHREAASQYTRAVRWSSNEPPRTRAELFGALADESALIDRWEEAAAARQEALTIYQSLGDDLRAGDSLRLLVAPMWRLCRGQESHQAALDAMALLAQLPPGPELARAVYSVAMVHWETDPPKALDLVHQAREMGLSLDMPDLVADSYNAEGGLLYLLGQDTEEAYRMGLELALAADLEAQVGRTYANLYAVTAESRDVVAAEAVFSDGSDYCDAHDIATFGTCLRGQRARSLAQQGQLAEGRELAQRLLSQALPSVNRLNPLLADVVLQARAGHDAAAQASLDEVCELARGLDEADWTQKLHSVVCEVGWLRAQVEPGRRSAALACELLTALDQWARGEVLAWARRYDLPTPSGISVAEPYALELDGDHAAAAAAWRARGAHYDAAMALAFSADEQEVREAHDSFTLMDAPAAVSSTRRRLREMGAAVVPAGPRPSTRQNPAGLTKREQEVLDHVMHGHSNAQISTALFLSERTVEHHISAVLSKLGVTSRIEARREAERRGLVASI